MTFWQKFLSMFIFAIPATAFGCYCLFVAYKTWFAVSVENIHEYHYGCNYIGISNWYWVLPAVILKMSILREISLPITMILQESSSGLQQVINKMAWFALRDKLGAAERSQSDFSFSGWHSFYISVLPTSLRIGPQGGRIYTCP